MQDFKRALGLNCKETRIEEFNFFNWLSNAKKSIAFNWVCARANCDPMALK